MTSLPISLPEGFTPLVQKGTSITPGQTIATREAPKEEVLNLFEGLQIKRSEAKKVLQVSPGDQVVPGDVIAVKKSLFGKISKQVVSQIHGTILRYERDTGNLAVQLDQEASSLEIISPVAGTVSLCNNKEIVIRTESAVVCNGVALGTNAQGELFILQESFADGADNTLYYLDSRTAGKIVAVKTITRDLVSKSDSLGVVGLLGVTISDSDIVYLEEKKIDFPILEIDEKLLTSVRQWEHKRVYVDVQNKAIVLL